MKLEEDNSLKSYYKDIGKYKQISREEEVVLSTRIQNGDKKALDKLVRHNLKFVVSVARNYDHQGIPMADLIAVGNMGLLSAAKRFDGGKNFKFISYAVWWVRQAILQELASQSRITRIPINKISGITNYQKISSKLEISKQGTPTIKEISDELDIPYKDVDMYRILSQNAVSLDSPIGDDQNNPCLLDILKADTDEDTDSLLTEKRELLEEILALLPKRERTILRLYYGMDQDDTFLTLEQIGKVLGITRERARQIRDQALRRLKGMGKQFNKLEDYK